LNEIVSKIHDASLRILRECGFKVSNGLIISALKENGIRIQGDTAFFEQEQLMNLVKRAPGQFTLYARNPTYNMNIGGDKTYFAPGYGCTSVTGADGSMRSGTYSDYISFARLVHKSEHFKINGGILVQPCDISSDKASMAMIYADIIVSDKCILGIPGTTADVSRIMDMCSIVFGGYEKFCLRPHILTLINTVSPLQLGNIAEDTIIACARYKQPLIISPGPMSGATGPVTAAGNIALGNAETLAAIAIVQAVCPGLPVIYGFQPSTMNMATGGVSIGTPYCSVQMEYSAKLAKAYGLPNRCGGALTDAKTNGAQSSSESMLALIAAVQQRTSLVLHSAGILNSYGSMSYEKFIFDLRALDMINLYMTSLDVSDESLAIDAILEIGAGGEFLTSEHTLRNWRNNVWLNEGGDSCAMLREYVQPSINSLVRQQLDDYITEYLGYETIVKTQTILDKYDNTI
jgi:trimethylamine--corrinoid protein Co-methyltransferase